MIGARELAEQRATRRVSIGTRREQEIAARENGLHPPSVEHVAERRA